MSLILAGLFSNISVNAYSDYEEWYVDSQNPEVQQVIRENCKFPLEDNMWINLQILYNWLKCSFTYDKAYAWKTIPTILNNRKGVCDDFARLYYSLLRGIGWPEHRIQLVYGPVYDLLDNLQNWHAWVEIKSPNPTGTILSYSANESISGLEGKQILLGLNETIVTSELITSENITNVRTLGWGERNGWIPIDPTSGVCNPWMPFLPSLWLTFGYHLYYLFGLKIHYNEVYSPYIVQRENPTWDNFTITLAPYTDFNVSYLHSVELYIITFRITSTVNSTAPISLTIWNPKGQLIDYHWNITNHEYRINFTYQTSPPFPKDLGLYWICVENPWNQTATVTFNKLSESKMAWLSGEETINQTMYDQYSSYDIGMTDIAPAKTIIGQRYTSSINVTVANYGFRTETFNVTVYANTTSIASQNITLTSGNSTTITSIWNTSSFTYGNYTIWAYAWPVPDEIDTTDNNCTNGLILVTIPGDVNGDFRCEGKDIAIISKAYGTRAGEVGYVPNADIIEDGKIDGKDLAVVSKYYGTHYP
jgi:hypothetical protein